MDHLLYHLCQHWLLFQVLLLRAELLNWLSLVSSLEGRLALSSHVCIRLSSKLEHMLLLVNKLVDNLLLLQSFWLFLFWEVHEEPVICSTYLSRIFDITLAFRQVILLEKSMVRCKLHQTN